MTSADASSLSSARQPYSQAPKKFIGYLDMRSKSVRSRIPSCPENLTDGTVISSQRLVESSQASSPLFPGFVYQPTLKPELLSEFSRNSGKSPAEPDFLEIGSKIPNMLYRSQSSKMRPKSFSDLKESVQDESRPLRISIPPLDPAAWLPRCCTANREIPILKAIPVRLLPKHSMPQPELTLCSTSISNKNSSPVYPTAKDCTEDNPFGENSIHMKVKAFPKAYLMMAPPLSLAQATRSQTGSRGLISSLRESLKKNFIVQYKSKQVPSSECHPNSTLEDVSRPSVSEQPQLSIRSRQASIVQQSPSQTLKDVLNCELLQNCLKVDLNRFRRLTHAYTVQPELQASYAGHIDAALARQKFSRESSSCSKSILVKRDQSSRDISRLNDSCSPKKKVAFAKNKMVLLYTVDH